MTSSAGKSKLLKVVLLGDGGVGKSSLMYRFVSNKFDSQSFHTIGVEFLNTDVVFDDEVLTMQIWDTAGQEHFRYLRTPFYRGADCCSGLTVAVDNLQSFKNLTTWRKEFVYYVDIQDGAAFLFVVIGNKVDVEGRQVRAELIKQRCSANGNLRYYETSAKDATIVEQAFLAVVKRHKEIEDQMEVGPTQSNTVDLNRARSRRQGSSCC